MQISKFVIASLITGFSFIGAPVQAQAPAREVEAISIKQTHSFFGKVAITATDNAVRIDDKNGLGFVLVARAPDWTVNVFRDNNKLILTESFDQFVNTGLVNEFILSRKEPIVRGEGAGEIRKPFMKYSIAETRFPRPFQFLPLPVSNNKKIPLLIASAYRTHFVEGFPLYQTTLLHQDLVAGNMFKDRPQLDLSTSSIEKVKVSSTIFDAPKGYTRTKTMPEVVSGPNSKEQTDNLRDMLGAEPIRK